jgi:hypothetical protein
MTRRRPWPCNCQAGGPEPDEREPETRPVPADHNEFIREKWEYARKIEAIIALWVAAGPDWMR